LFSYNLGHKGSHQCQRFHRESQLKGKIMSQVSAQNPPEIPPSLPNASEPAKGGKGLAVTSMVLGLVGLPTCLLSIVAVILGIVSLAKKRPGKGFAITGIITGALGVLLVFPFVVGFQGFEMLINPGPNRADCVRNLNGISKAIMLYKASYDEEYPPDLEVLVKDGQSPKIFQCPSATNHRTFDYFYVAPALNAPPETMVACDYKTNHQGEARNVLYADGHVARLNKPAFQQALSQPENAAFAAALKKAEGP
jgi:prepilin-type processing-associated H-X9-DG protein